MNSEYKARLALPMGTMEIIPGFSGAGERMPALAQDASAPGSRASNNATRKSLRASSRAMALPINPPPAMIASYDFIPAFYRIRGRDDLPVRHGPLLIRRESARVLNSRASSQALRRVPVLFSRGFWRVSSRRLLPRPLIHQETNLPSRPNPLGPDLACALLSR